MFRFIHAADIHLDSPLRGLSRYETAPVDAIRGACRRAFENLVDLAVEEKVAFVLLAGDLYDGDWKDFSTGIFVSRQIGRLNDCGIPVIAAAGNHDAANRMTSALDPPANMTFLASRSPETIRLERCPAAVHGQGFATQHVSENLAARYPDAEPGLFNIGLLHTSLDGRAGHADYAPCTIADLRSRNYQYWALGHVHKREIVAEDPWIVFPGCVQGRHIRETGTKGCTLVTVEDGSVSSAVHRELDVLRWIFCLIDLEEVEDRAGLLDRIRQAMTSELDAADGRPVAMRVRFEGASPLADEIAAYPDRMESQVIALAAETAGEDVWIEKVESVATGKLDLDAVLSSDGPLGALLEQIASLPEEMGSIDGLDGIIVDLKQKLPAEAVGSERGLDLDDPEKIASLVREAKKMLVGRLLAAGGRP